MELQRQKEHLVGQFLRIAQLGHESLLARAHALGCCQAITFGSGLGSCQTKAPLALRIGLQGVVERLSSEVGPQRRHEDQLDPARLQIDIEGTTVFAGLPLDYDEAALSGSMKHGEVTIRVDLGLGSGTGEAFGCDLTQEYVIENSEYST